MTDTNTLDREHTAVRLAADELEAVNAKIAEVKATITTLTNAVAQADPNDLAALESLVSARRVQEARLEAFAPTVAARRSALADAQAALRAAEIAGLEEQLREHDLALSQANNDLRERAVKFARQFVRDVADLRERAVAGHHKEIAWRTARGEAVDRTRFAGSFRGASLAAGDSFEVLAQLVEDARSNAVPQPVLARYTPPQPTRPTSFADQREATADPGVIGSFFVDSEGRVRRDGVPQVANTDTVEHEFNPFDGKE